LLSDSPEETPYSQFSTITHDKALLCPSALDSSETFFKLYPYRLNKSGTPISVKDTLEQPTQSVHLQKPLLVFS